MSVYGKYLGSEAWPPARERPAGVTALIVLSAFVCLFGIVGIVTLLVRPAALVTDGDVGLPFSVPAAARWPVALGMSFVELAVFGALAWGFAAGRRAAWTLALVVTAFGILSTFATIASGRAPATLLTGVVINIIIASYLMTPRVKRYFGV